MLNRDLNESSEGGKFKNFVEAAPFPHMVIDNFLDEDVCRKLSEEIESVAGSTSYYRHYNQKKYAITDPLQFPPIASMVTNYLISDEFLKKVELLTGIKGLIADPDFDGGGIHVIKSGGFLNVHTDFLSHPKKLNLRRVLNLIVYLNLDWRLDYGGELEFWDSKGRTKLKSIQPTFNRAVLFKTDHESFHGHPEPLLTPEGVLRKSIALYYFTEKTLDGLDTPANTATHYIGTHKNTFVQRIMIALDGALIQLYSSLRRKGLFSDKSFQKLIGSLGKRNKP